MISRCVAAALLLVALPFFSPAQEIRRINTEVSLYKDGSAQVRQHWDVTVVDGTEWYIPVSNLGEMKISDFTVSEGDVEFENVGAWDVSGTMEEKAGKCGIVDKGKDGVELCWGQGSMGQHEWVCSYRISGLVQSLEDCDAFNYQFVNPGLSVRPESIVLQIKDGSGCMDWNSSNTRIWAFGFEGEVNLIDGQISASSDGEVRYANVMVRFDKGMFSPALSRDCDFESMRKKAFKNSGYAEGFPYWLLVMAGLAAVAAAGFIYMLFCLISGHVYRKTMFGRSKITEWYREAPLGNDIPAVWYVYKNGGRFFSKASPDKLVGTYFLRWIMDGAISAKADGNKRGKFSLVFSEKVPSFSCEEEKIFYDMAVEASGDRILETAEFKKWSKDNYEKLISWPSDIENTGFSHLVEKGCLRGMRRASAGMEDELAKVIEFRNFLNDFTLSEERNVEEVKLWRDYLVYAQMFGIAEKVSRQFRTLYPDFFREVAESSGLDSVQLLYLVNMADRMSSTGYAAALSHMSELSADAKGGFGGGTSFGGGGGFSGGGFGGGSR